MIFKRSNAKLLLGTGLVAATLFFSFKQPLPSKTEKSVKLEPSDIIKRGEYLVTVGGCNDCHSPKIFGPQGPQPDPARLLSGHPGNQPILKVDSGAVGNWILMNGENTATVGPWGVSYAANLTSDATGIGNWTLAQFKKSLREGKYKGLDNTRPLLPPMPWPNYAKMSDEDLEAVFAYLKSTKPVSNIVPAPAPLNDLIK